MENKTDRIILLKEFLITQMNHWILFPLYVMIVVQIGDITGTGTPHILLWLALGCLPFLLYFGRAKLRKFWALVLLHFAVILTMFLIPAENSSIRIFHLVIGIYYVVYSCYLWVVTTNGQDAKFYPLFAVALSVSMMFFLHYDEHTEWDGAYITALIVVLGIYFLIYYIEQYQSFLIVNNNSAGHIPTTEMFRSGIGLVMAYTGIGAVALFLISNVNWLTGILNIFQKIIYFILSIIVTLFFGNAGELLEPSGESMAETGGLPSDDLKTFWLWEVLEFLLTIVIIAAIIILFIKALLFVIKFIRNKLNNLPRSTQNLSAESIRDVREKCEIVRNKERKVNLPFLLLNPKDRIRHLYKKRILSSRDAFLQGDEDRFLNRYTARESSKILEKDDLALIYEKARYSNEECSSEDVKQMRNACKLYK